MKLDNFLKEAGISKAHIARQVGMTREAFFYAMFERGFKDSEKKSVKKFLNKISKMINSVNL